MANINVSSGVTSDGIILRSDYMTVLEGGSANSITVNSGGSMLVLSGAKATQVRENGGFVQIGLLDATVTFVPTTLSGLTLIKNSATLHSGTTALSAPRSIIISKCWASPTTRSSWGSGFLRSFPRWQDSPP